MNRLAGLDGMAFDAVVIGGGMAGAGVARDLALRGASVALFEKGDFSSGTTSKSSKLIHGGLRYLELGDFKLVRESLREKKPLLDQQVAMLEDVIGRLLDGSGGPPITGTPPTQ